MVRGHTENLIKKFIDNFQHIRRNNIDLTRPQFKTALYKNSILCSGSKQFNSLPLNKKALVKTNKYQSFKREIIVFLLNS